MRNIRINILFIVFVFSLSFSLRVYAQNWRPLDVLSILNGLPSDEVKQLYQDRDGYIWIATYDGLCRYDGYQLKIYKANLHTPNLLSSNKINTMAEDDNHNLWIGTANGLNVLNKITGEIRQINPGKMSNNIIQKILTTKKNEVWIGTAFGLHKYVAEKDSFIVYTNMNTNYKLLGNDIKALLEDDKGSIWIGTWGDGLTRYDPEKKEFIPYPRVNPKNSAHVIFEDNKKNIWIGSWGYGLFRLENPYDLQLVKYINYRHSKNDAHTLSDDVVYALSQDLNTNTIWVGTRSGLSVLKDPDNPSSFTNYLPNHKEQSISYNELNSVIRDNSGLMWLGMLGGGVSVINTQKWVFNLNRLESVKNRISSNSVRSLHVDKNGIIWLGVGSYGSSGMVIYDRNKDHYMYWEDNPDLRKVPIISTVNMITQLGKDQSYWFGTYGDGIVVYNPETSSENRVKNLNTKNTPWLNDDCVYYFKEGTNGNIWIGTREGLCIYDPEKDEGFSYSSFGQKKEESVLLSVRCIEDAGENTMWLATISRGIFKIKINPSDPEKIHTQSYDISNKKINCDNVQYLYNDSKQRLWAGTEGGGLSLYDPKTDSFVCVHQKYNLPGDIVYNIIEDNNGDLWLGTNSGLLRLKIDSDLNVTYRIYTTSDGLQGNFVNRDAIFKTEDGELFFGGHKGYNCFYPGKLPENGFMSPIVITDVKIFNKSFGTLPEKTRNKISKETPGFTSEIRLPYDYNNFSIEFSTLSYANPMLHKYAYRLDSFDKEWQYTDASRRFASYNNLGSGTYMFYLKASNENGIWNEATPLKVVILPPPWLTWWAFFIYFVLLILIIYFGMRAARSKMLLQNALRVRDLENQKTEELNHAKLQFFTNITHEFLTPLTILSASLDELKVVSPQNNGFYDVMTRNINRLIRLLQQILEFRKAETGNLKLKVSRGDMAAFVKSGVDSFRPLMKKNKMHFSLICDPEIIPAYFDHDKLDKIIYNLLSNASKYNKEGGFVQVNVCYDPEDRDQVIISVKDNGEGISPQEIKGLFKRFYEGDYRRFNTIGTGIGLSLTKDLVDLHRGEIYVESEVGKGSIFYVKIPVVKSYYDPDQIDDYEYIAEPLPVDTPESEDPDEKEEKEHSLLLIEDNEELLQLMVKLLHREYNVLTARNGKEGIIVIEENDVDLVVSDIMMPEMDGIEFCKYVKNKFEICHIPVILLTAKNKEEDKIEAYDSGADGFISKPFNLHLLHSKIKNLLKARERVAQDFKKQFVFELKDMNYTSVDEEFLQRCVDCVHNHLNDSNLDQLQFSEALGTSKSTLYKKLKSLTGLNTSSFIRNIRLKAACKIIEEKKRIRISELAYAVGFNDPKYFSACFKKEFGMIPSEFLDKILASEGIVRTEEDE